MTIDYGVPQGSVPLLFLWMTFSMLFLALK